VNYIYEPNLIIRTAPGEKLECAWVPGRRDYWLKISAVEVSGRRFSRPTQ
jgi:hypothetical protein